MATQRLRKRITFRLRYESEPDTDWTMVVEGTVQAESLVGAFNLATGSLGGRLALVCADPRRWTAWADGQQVDTCEVCDGYGMDIDTDDHLCPKCGSSGCVPVGSEQ